MLNQLINRDIAFLKIRWYVPIRDKTFVDPEKNEK